MRHFSIEPDIANISPVRVETVHGKWPLALSFPYTDGEVGHAVRSEYAQTARRVGTTNASGQVRCPGCFSYTAVVIDVMGKDLSWAK